MSVEKPTLEELYYAFNIKMDAARFFYNQIGRIYEPGGKISINIPDKLFYYVDAVIFELHAASQMFLQIINIKSGLNMPLNKVSWNPIFKQRLKESNSLLFEWWEEFSMSPEFHVLESIRQFISHRGGNFLQAEVLNDMIVLLSIPIRFKYYKGVPKLNPTGKSIELLDELSAIANHLNRSFNELKLTEV